MLASRARRPGAAVALQAQQVDRIAGELEGQHPTEIVAYALREYGPDLTISFSGAEDVALVDMAARTKQPFRVFTLDTGRLHPETYRFIEAVRERYEIAIESYSPQAEAVEALGAREGAVLLLPRRSPGVLLHP